MEIILLLLVLAFVIIIIPTMFDCIKTKKKTKKDRRDAPTVWRRKR